MWRWILLVSLMGGLLTAAGQKTKQSGHKQQAIKRDSLFADNGEARDPIPAVLMDENSRTENSPQYIAPLLTANRDPFQSAAAFHFGALRFRVRGYDARFFITVMNGLPMNSPENGNSPWMLWGGLNDVLRNTTVTQGLRNSDHSFGSIGNTVHIDTRASKQREQTQFSYAMSNRSYTHRWVFTHHTGRQPSGWAFSFSGSRRWAEEGYTPGTFYDGWSYFLAADKQLGARQTISFQLMGAPLKSGRQGAVLQESAELLGKNYNPYWGYQAGKKRNTNVSGQHQPVFMLVNELRWNNRYKLFSALAFITGYQSSTGLDWYKAADPRPDYYRYLPSFQTDSVLREYVATAILQDRNLQQINWQKMFEVNRNDVSTIHDVDGVVGKHITGNRSHYILEERIGRQQRFNLNHIFQVTCTPRLLLTAGLNLQLQTHRYYKEIKDLLGGTFYVNWNQFAERDFPNNPNALQYDMDRPNRILGYGDRFGYDYSMHTRYGSAWLQATMTGNRMDGFAAASFSHTRYQRIGHLRNGLFPGSSLGRSYPIRFGNYGAKAGITYKLNGRNYIYAHVLMETRAPLPDNVFISPRTRDHGQEAAVNERIRSMEMGYIRNAPDVRFRITGYFTQLADGMNVLSFYHDEYRSFVNYAISNIRQLHYGLESGAELKWNERWSVALAAAIGNYDFNSRQQVSVSLDNDAYVIAREQLYTLHFRVPGTPQGAYHMEWRYQSPRFFFMNMAMNYFHRQWLDFNPVRRSYHALQDVVPQSEQWNKIIAQTMLPPAYTVNLFGGKSWRLRTSRKNTYRMLSFTISISNLLNNRNMISGGYEQLRFDTDTKDPDRFPPKLFYGYGINFFAGISLRL